MWDFLLLYDRSEGLYFVEHTKRDSTLVCLMYFLSICHFFFLAVPDKEVVIVGGSTTSVSSTMYNSLNEIACTIASYNQVTMTSTDQVCDYVFGRGICCGGSNWFHEILLCTYFQKKKTLNKNSWKHNLQEYNPIPMNQLIAACITMVLPRPGYHFLTCLTG